jgi:chorismate mutase
MDNKKTCNLIQDILIKQSYEGALPPADIEKLENHLARCELCKKYRQILTEISASQKMQPFDITAVETAVKQAVLHSFPQKNQAGYLQWIWKYVMELFRYRMPVYQSVIAFVILFFFFYKIDSISTEEKENTVQTTDSLAISKIPMNYSYIIDNFEIIESQRIGETIKEDSSVIEFTYTVL